MNKSETITKIAPALLKAQKLIESAVKGADNPFFRSKYANLNSVMDSCKQHLNDNGITVLQPVFSDEHGDYVETILLHESGEFLSSRMKLVLSKNDMQAYGSAVSYARRYGLQSMVFIGAEDDDAEASVGRSAPAKTYTKPISVPATNLEVSTQEAPKKVSSFKKPTKTPTLTEAASAVANSDDWN